MLLAGLFGQANTLASLREIAPGVEVTVVRPSVYPQSDGLAAWATRSVAPLVLTAESPSSRKLGSGSAAAKPVGPLRLP